MTTVVIGSVSTAGSALPRASLVRFVLLGLVTLGVLGIAPRSAHADVTIARWTFENDIGQINSVAQNSNSALLTPAVGAGTGKGHHANSSTQWTAIAGNGSSTAFNSNQWSVGDYYEFDVDTTGKTNVQLSFDQLSSFTGPAQFKVQTSTGGSNWTDLTSYTVQGTLNWNTYTYNLMNGIVGVRLVDNSTVATSGLTVSGTGASRVDNVALTGTVAAIPEPVFCQMGVLLALGGTRLLFRRFKR